jgi:hypothetical protein
LDGIWLDQHLLLSGLEPVAAEWGLPVPPRAGAHHHRSGLRRSCPRTRQSITEPAGRHIAVKAEPVAVLAGPEP